MFGTKKTTTYYTKDLFWKKIFETHHMLKGKKKKLKSPYLDHNKVSPKKSPFGEGFACCVSNVFKMYVKHYYDYFYHKLIYMLLHYIQFLMNSYV
jgi:hypothetical protein